MMNDKDLKEFHDLDKLKTYQPLPSGLCKRYWDESKDGLRTANAPWTIEVRK